MQIVNANSGLGAFGISVAASALYGLAVFFAELFYSKTGHSNPSYRRRRLGAFVLLWLILNAASFLCFSSWWLVLLITSIVLAVVMFKELNQFWQIGLVGADREVQSGIGYAAALNMCQNSFHFLGIGAAKLTRNQEAFRNAIDRCNRTTPVRLLLSRPDDPVLERIAQMALKERDLYRRTVTESLKFIAALRNIEQKNIKVRFYQEVPAFRLMFVDETICLMSYYIMGKGDGSNIPQLHIVKTPGSQDTQALYFGFAEYYEKIWNESTDWDFKEFL